MPNPDNIKGHEFKKGESGNPKGRPKGSLNAATYIKKWLDAEQKSLNPITDQEETLTQHDIIVLRQISKARKGDTFAFNALYDRSEGRPTQRTEEIGDKEIIINFVPDGSKHPDPDPPSGAGEDQEGE